MLKLIAPRVPRRTPATSLDELVLDEGRSRVVFSHVRPSDLFRIDSTGRSRFLVTNHLPPAPKSPLDPNSANSSLCPPFHIHLKEDETFHVLSGHAKFMLLDQSCQVVADGGTSCEDGCTHRVVSPGEIITIPRGQIHTFRNASSDKSLVLEFGFSPPGSERANEALNAKMRQFFMNIQRYRSDCATQGVPMSQPQLMLFNRNADLALVPSWMLAAHKRFPWLRSLIERYLAPSLGRMMNLLGGVVLGRWLFGLRSTYEEYYPSARLQFIDGITEEEPETKEVLGVMNVADQKDRGILENKDAQRTTPEWACQAWRDHSFDGQSDSWRK